MPVYISTKMLVMCIFVLLLIEIQRNCVSQKLTLLFVAILEIGYVTAKSNCGAHDSNLKTIESLVYLPNCWSNFHDFFTKHNGL